MKFTTFCLIVFAALSWSIFPGWAQGAETIPQAQGAIGPLAQMGPGMMHNMGTMADMMKEMHQMMDHLNPDQQKEMLKLMKRMGGIMQQMHGPKAVQMQQVHSEQLQRMQEQLQLMKTKIKKQ